MNVTALGFREGETPYEEDIPSLIDFSQSDITNPLRYDLTCYTGDKFRTPSQYEDVIDMEAYAIAKVCYLHNVDFISYKYSINFDDVMKDFQEYTKSEKETFTINYVRDEYKNFLDANEDRLTDEFNAEQQFQTSTRGLKIRGSYSTQEEAELRCKLLREVDPNHNVYVGPVGMWMPWEPEAYKTGRVEYLEEELNQLMSEKNTNEASAKTEFEKRVLEAKRNAIEENKKLAKESGNKLTQNINKDGQLVGINNTIENVLNTKEEVTSADIRKELFEGDNVPTNSATQDAIDRGLMEDPNKETENVKVEITEKVEDNQDEEKKD